MAYFILVGISAWKEWENSNSASNRILFNLLIQSLNSDGVTLIKEIAIFKVNK